MVKLKFLVIAIIAILGIAYSSNIKTENTRASGMSMFDHDSHYVGGYCQACHHDYDGEPVTNSDLIEDGEIETDCMACHDEGIHFNHEQCVACHKNNNEPILCASCHKGGNNE